MSDALSHWQEYRLTEAYEVMRTVEALWESEATESKS